MKKLFTLLFVAGVAVAITSCGGNAKKDDQAKLDSLKKDSLMKDSIAKVAAATPKVDSAALKAKEDSAKKAAEAAPAKEEKKGKK